MVLERLDEDEGVGPTSLTRNIRMVDFALFPRSIRRILKITI